MSRTNKAATFTALDQLPPEIRHAIAYSARVWDATDILPQFKAAVRRMGKAEATAWMIDSVRACDRGAILEAARAWAVRYGDFPPFVEPIGYREPVHHAFKRPRLKGATKRAFEASERLLPRSVAGP